MGSMYDRIIANAKNDDKDNKISNKENMYDRIIANAKKLNVSDDITNQETSTYYNKTNNIYSLALAKEYAKNALEKGFTDKFMIE